MEPGDTGPCQLMGRTPPPGLVAGPAHQCYHIVTGWEELQQIPQATSQTELGCYIFLVSGQQSITLRFLARSLIRANSVIIFRKNYNLSHKENHLLWVGITLINGCYKIVIFLWTFIAVEFNKLMCMQALKVWYNVLIFIFTPCTWLKRNLKMNFILKQTIISRRTSTFHECIFRVLRILCKMTPNMEEKRSIE